eukprot:NODE_1182_length_1889_cov_0.492737.p1 type:complete len:248 gc:universal NODE_1182_length_1889_cov_0.492737:320-1063(+)
MYKSSLKIIKQLKNRKIAKEKKENHIKNITKKATLVHSNQKKDYFLEIIKSSEHILLVGEGNFSFAASITDMYPHKHVIATVFDSKDILAKKYPMANVNAEKLNNPVQYEIDCIKLHKTKSITQEYFDLIIFNFPHVGQGIKDQFHNIKANQKLLRGFFMSIRNLNRPNLIICVTLKDREPYTLWDIKHIAKTCRLICKRTCTFFTSTFSGYEHRRTIGFQEGLSKSKNEELGQCKTYIFQVCSNED